MKEIDWEIVKALAPAIAAVIAASVFIYTILKDRKTKKREEVSRFLGNKEPVAYAALKIIREGFKGSNEEIAEQIQMVMQGCLFEGSDRARALLYYIVIKNKDDKGYKTTFTAMYNHILDVEREIDKYEFSGGEEGELDRSNFNLRISALKKIFTQNTEGGIQ